MHIGGLTLLPLHAHSQQSDESGQISIQVTEGQRVAVGSISMASEPIQRLISNPAVSLSLRGGRNSDPFNTEAVRVNEAGRTVRGFFISGRGERA